MRYGAVTAVEHVSFNAHAGRVTVILGPNGAGKTSTIEACEGFRAVTSGSVRVLGLDPQRDRLPAHHIIAEMCALAGLHGEIAVRPYVHLTDAERAAGRHFPLQIALHSSGLAAAIPNTIKEWGPDRFATLAGQLASHAQLIQLGSPKDPALPVHLDLRGKTTLRQAAAVLSASTVFVGLEGFLGHLARAVDCPSVIVIGGRATAESVGYLANHNLTSSPECAPCNRRSACSYNMKCMAAISPEAVASAAHGLLNRPPARPLVHDTALLP